MENNVNYEERYEKYKQAINGASMAAWEWNIQENKLYTSYVWTEITGYEKNYFNNLSDFIKTVTLKEDTESALNDLDFYIEGKTAFYRSEYRIITKMKEIKWLLFKGKLLKGNDGRVKSLSGLVNDITEEKNKEKTITNIVYRDSLTGLPNRGLFLMDFKNVLKMTLETNKEGAVVFIDLDDFKSINDTLGHDYGDLLLKVFSQLLEVCAKQDCSVYRLGGDEFIILIKEFNSIQEVENLCCNILEYCKKPFELNEKQIYITTSMGVASFPKDSLNLNDLLKFADLAMYQSKIKGKNSYTFFEDFIFKSYLRKVSIEQELKNSIKNEEFFIVYQPQVDVSKNKIVGIEALLRWNNEKLGFVSPDEFIPIAEETGMIIDIGDWVLETVCKKIHELKEKNYEFKNVSVNISPIQIREANFKNKILRICKKNDVSLNLLEIEITEGTLMELNKKRTEDLNDLIINGINIAIDDFGTGYSSLNYLTVLPVNTLKIDKTFIDKIEYEKNRAVIDCILRLSKALKYKVVAEGVETKAQLDLLIEAKCNLIQGYYFYKPVSEKEIESILEEAII